MSQSNEKAWKETPDALEKTYAFKSFPLAMSFMLRVSYVCERMDHHPSWHNVYDKVSVKLNTHDAGDKVTDKDRALAKEMDKIAQDFAS